MKIRAILKRAIVLLAFLSVSELSAQEQVGEVFPYALTTAASSTTISEISEGVLVDIYWTGTPAEFSGRTITRLVAHKTRLISTKEIGPSSSTHPNLMQVEITVAMNAETIRTLESLSDVGQYVIVISE